MTRAQFLKRLDAACSRLERDGVGLGDGYLAALRDVDAMLRDGRPSDPLRCWRRSIDVPNAARRVGQREGRDGAT